MTIPRPEGLPYRAEPADPTIVKDADLQAELAEFLHADSPGSTLPSTATRIGELFLRTGATNPGMYVAENLLGSWLGPISTGGGGGSVATDNIWNAAGDLVVGTGDNAAARLALGTALQVLHVNAGATAVEYVSSSGTGSVARVANPTLQASGSTGVTINVTGNTTRSIGLTLLNTTDTAAGSDPNDYVDEVHLVFKTGTTATHRRYLDFLDHTGADQWLVGCNAGGNWIHYDSNGGHRFYMEPNGLTQLNSCGSASVEINNYPGPDTLGTGGFKVYSGGATTGRHVVATIASGDDHSYFVGRIYWGGASGSETGRLNTSGIDAYVEAYQDGGHVILRDNVASVMTERLRTNATGVAVTGVLSVSGSMTVSTSPSAGTDATNKNYVDNAINGLNWKTACRVATTADITLSGTQTIDGVSVIAADRVLVKAQSTTSQNGIYVVAAGSWTRATDCDTAAEIDGSAVYVRLGTTLADTAWTETATVTTLGTDAVAYTQIGSGATYLAGASLTLTGNTFALSATPALGTPSSGNLANCTFPTLNQSTTGSAASLLTSRSIFGVSFNGTADVTGIIASNFGGTGNGFFKITGPTTAERTKTVRDANDTIMEIGGSYTVTGTWTNVTLVTPTLGKGTYTLLKQDGTEPSTTPTGTTATLDLNNGNKQTINLGSASGDVTLTLTIPSGTCSASGRILAKQGATCRNLTIAASDASTIRYYDTKQDSSTDAASTARAYHWDWDGTNIYIGQTAATTS